MPKYNSCHLFAYQLAYIEEENIKRKNYNVQSNFFLSIKALFFNNI